VANIHDELTERIKNLERDLEAALEEKHQALQFQWAKGKVKFETAVLSEHKKLKSSLHRYVLDSTFLTILTAPVIYVGVIPFAMLDLFLVIYQAICFPVYGIPKAKRADYFVFDRGLLKYLNLVERINCLYCSYGNAVVGYAGEISARTEQHWCPIKHARRLRSAHSRYAHFLDYGNADEYRKQIETVRNNFVDVRTLTQPGPPKKKDVG